MSDAKWIDTALLLHLEKAAFSLGHACMWSDTHEGLSYWWPVKLRPEEMAREMRAAQPTNKGLWGVGRSPPSESFPTLDEYEGAP